MQRAYELMVIVDTDVDDQSIGQFLDRVSEMIEAGGSRVASLDRWGRRKFAFPINKKNEGYYAVYEIASPGSVLGDVDRFLRLADEAVRHKIVRLPDSEAERRGLMGTTSKAD